MSRIANASAKSKEVQTDTHIQRTIAPHLLLPQPHPDTLLDQPLYGNP
jgi:hypothetical protein